ncbi:hypothetical protein ACEZ3G_04640 [Maribacter algicola]|uniref:Uncharacterized protein n=1 Tax=Meishania litoralis TaxID=3434685 RepID=A0ACC7LH44_9FLAO
MQTPVPFELLNPYFSQISKDYVYKARIKAFDKSFGGIFIVKKLGEDHHRIVFTTEMGNTIFDFEFIDEEFKINRILPEMDKKALKNILKSDFLALISAKPEIFEMFAKTENTIVAAEILSKKHYYWFTGEQLTKISRTAREKEKVTFSFSRINNNIAEEIRIIHQNVKLEIILTLL